jgi:serine/threonine-protein kinase ULK4
MSLLKSYKQSALRAKICEVLGLLIRHATSIDSDILKYGIISGFVEAVTKDKSEKVRRKAMAALGELLFYGATQVD